jgi:peptide/nickel transport system substrate-binding protein
MTAALLVTACGNDDDDTSSPPAGDTSTTANSEGEEAAPDDAIPVGMTSVPVADDFDENATFSWAYTIEVSSFDPHRGNSGFDQNWLFPVYDRLVYSAPDGSLQPMLATEWTVDDDATRIDMTLREGVKFHDGTDFDADAVKANLDRARTDELSVLKPDLESLTEVEVAGPYEVTLLIDGGAAPLLASLADRAGMMISPAAFDSPDLARSPVGAGAYRVSEYRLGDRVIYERFEDYWEPEVQRTAAIEFRIMSDDQTRLNALQADEITMALIRQNQVPIVEDAGLEVLAGPTPTFYSFAVNAAMEPFDDERVRLALQHAMNREEISVGLFDGLCTAQIQPWPSVSFAYDPELGSGLDVWDHDPDKAKQLLEEAGLSEGFSFTAVTPNITGYISIAEVLQDQFSEAGIDMQIRVLEATQVSEEFNVAKTAEATVGAYSPSPDPDGVMSRSLLPEALGNPGQLSSDAMVELAEEARNAVDAEQRAPLYHELMQELIDLVPHATPICMQTRTEGFQPSVSGIDIYASGARDFRGVAVSR